MRIIAISVVSLIFLFLPLLASAERLSVAVAANFLGTLEQLKPGFEAASGHQLEISWGSTGKLYLQITQGAPYQLFLAADSVRPQRLVDAGLAVASSRVTYAVGCLALYSRYSTALAAEGEQWLRGSEKGYLAISNPALAPYGIAARQTLQGLGLWSAYQGRLVLGENVNQTFRYVVSSAAEAGLVARSQVQTAVAEWGGSYWLVPARLYSPIEQQLVVLSSAQQSPAAQAFVEWLQGAAAQAIILDHGYSLERCG